MWPSKRSTNWFKISKKSIKCLNITNLRVSFQQWSRRPSWSQTYSLDVKVPQLPWPTHHRAFHSSNISFDWCSLRRWGQRRSNCPNHSLQTYEASRLGCMKLLSKLKQSLTRHVVIEREAVAFWRRSSYKRTNNSCACAFKLEKFISIPIQQRYAMF